MDIKYLYIAEAIFFVLLLIVGLLIWFIKHKKWALRMALIGLAVGIIAIGATFVLEKPHINLDELANVEVINGDQKQKISVMYHFQDISDKVKIVGDVDYNKVGEYDVKIEVDTLTGKYSKDAKIKVVDTKAPEITLNEGEEYKQTYGKEYVEPGVVAKDEYDGDLTENIKIEKEEINETSFNIKYIVEDASGNRAEKVRHVTIVDNTPPVITLNGNKMETVYLNKTYTEKGATAVDEKDGDVSSKIAISGTVDTTKEGVYEITYKVMDAAENEATEVRTVVVKKYLQAQSGGTGTAGVIYLTFDDGPSSSITPHILDILKAKNVKATFFILNYDSAGEALVKREYNEGHTVAIHGYSHDYGEIYKSEEAYMANLTKLQDKIKTTTGGYVATITRFPGGSSNTVSSFNPGIMTRLASLVQQRGFKYFDWNVSSGDAGGAQTSQDVYNNVTRNLSKNCANVVLMHDFYGNTKTLNALEDIIDYGIENGYTFSRITNDTPMVTHRISN